LAGSEAPAGLTLADVKIGGVPIAFGAHVAEHIQMRLGATVSAVQQTAAPRAIGCVGDAPASVTPMFKPAIGVRA
jgi:hypothetical protein